jgi:hypothetical protein
MTILASGNVGIGTTSPTNSVVQIKGANNTVSGYDDGLKVTSNNETVYVNYNWTGINANDTLRIATTGTERMRIRSDGSILFSTTATLTTDNNTLTPYSTNGYLYLMGGSTGLALTGSGSRQNAIYLNTTSNIIAFHTNDTGEKMRITSGGNVLIGTTTDAGYKLEVNGQVRATAFFESSDKRLKKEISENPSIDGISQIKPKLYIKDGKEELGYYAQDLQKVLPSSVMEGRDGFLSLSYTQVHTAKIAQLEYKIEQLEKLIKTLIK